MTICGYNEKIGGGLRLLVQGMVEALERKSQDRPIEEVLQREVMELEAMIDALRVADRNTLAQMFVGLNFLARALFEQVRQNARMTPGGLWSDECRSVGEAFIILLSRTEDQSEQQRAAGRTDESPERLARELAQWALKHSEEDGILRLCTVNEAHLAVPFETQIVNTI